jgi:hypothetical protein
MKLVQPFRGQLGSEEKLGLEANGSAPSAVPSILILLFGDGKHALRINQLGRMDPSSRASSSAQWF